ncbi:MAG: SPOR domain-containing protein [Dysgonamonadaceae bacterium]|jgi:cell division protein FtsN|nr:SPOR domain-containing protein [Dysgonamonadaceae bacterium]
MNSKFYLFGLVFVLLFSLSACKAKHSAYSQVYETAIARPIVEQEPAPAVSVPKTKPADTAVFQKEKVKPVDGNKLHQYSVVIGSFLNQTNAKSLKEHMETEGYHPVLAQNEKGNYRVIIATFNERSEAVVKREEIKEKYAPRFNDAWLLEQDF